MLNIDKSTVDFLVTENMVKEVEKVLEKDVPRVHAIVGAASSGVSKTVIDQIVEAGVVQFVGHHHVDA